MNPLIIDPDFTGDELQIGIVQARFSSEVAEIQLEACINELIELGVNSQDIVVASVPGALELGVSLAQMADSFEFDALIALGAVIRGDTYHFEIVSNESAAAISKVSLSHGIPIANGVLTTENSQQALDRAEIKGKECAQAAVEMANLLLALEPSLEDYEGAFLDNDDLEEEND